MYESVHSTLKRITGVFTENGRGMIVAPGVTKLLQISTWGAEKRIEDFQLLKQVTKAGIKKENDLRTETVQKFSLVEIAFLDVIDRIDKIGKNIKFNDLEKGIVERIEAHLIKNEMEQALLLLDELEIPKETTILLKKDFVKYKTEWSVGLISKEEYDVNSNRITFSIIQIIKDE